MHTMLQRGLREYIHYILTVCICIKYALMVCVHQWYRVYLNGDSREDVSIHTRCVCMRCIMM